MPDEMGQSVSIAFEDAANEFASRMMEFICETRSIDRVEFPKAPAFTKVDHARGLQHFREMALHHLSQPIENEMVLTDDNLDEFIEYIAAKNSNSEMYPPLLLDK